MGAASASLLTIVGYQAIVIGVLAALFAAVWLRARDPGMPWLVAGFALAAAWYYHSVYLPPGGPDIVAPVERLWSIVIGSAVLCVATGVVRYLGLPRGPARWAVWACGVPGLVQMALLAVGVPVSHHAFHVGVLLAYLGAAVLAFHRATTEPGDGHAVLGSSLLALAAMPYLLAMAGVAPGELQYVAGVLLAIFGMVLLTVSLLRRQRALALEVQRRSDAEAQLRDANVRLEARVSERTAHLRELIGGLEAFNRGVSHDLRGPLGSMAVLARMADEAMARGDLTLAQRALPMIAGQCDASERMVGAMLDLARIGDAPVRREPVALATLVQSAHDEVMLGVPEAERPVLQCAELPTVLADPPLLRAVFVNLIGNAAKFVRGRPGPRIEVSASVSGGDVTVCVRDNGIGFAPAVAERLFEPFFRAHATGAPGHGLGLSIVRRTVEAMGGTVWAQSPTTGGAALYLRLPGAVAPAAAAAPAPKAERLGEVTG